MSLMNVLSITLIVLILGAVVVLFFGMRNAEFAEVSRPSSGLALFHAQVV